MIGRTISHFKVTAKLGEGGMGAVYRAEDLKLGREVAIKVLPDSVAHDPGRLARFEREAKVLASLRFAIPTRARRSGAWSNRRSASTEPAQQAGPERVLAGRGEPGAWPAPEPRIPPARPGGDGQAGPGVEFYLPR
jgi:hypothetical protein